MAVRTVAKTITVAAGTGTSVFDFPSFAGYLLKVVSIDAPVGSTYDWIIRDAQGYALGGGSGFTDDQTFYYDVPSLGPLSLTFSTAVDGSYGVKVGVEFQA